MEIQLTDAILDMLKDGERVLFLQLWRKRYDIGNKVGLLKANIEFGLKMKKQREELLNIWKQNLN